MTHATLIGLAKAVASDMAANGLSRVTQTALRSLEDTPELAFDLVELIAKEGSRKRPKGDLIGGYAFLLLHALESLRFAVEAGDKASVALLERLRATLAEQSEAGQIGAPMLLLVLNQLVAAKLDVGDALRALMAQAVASDVNALDALGVCGDACSSASIARMLENDPFAIHAHLDQTAQTLPEDLRTKLATGVLDEEEPAMREAALGFFLSGSSRVRRALAERIGQAAAHGLVSPAMLRRMIAVRGWVPPADRPALERAIEACRLEGVAPAPPCPQPRTVEVMASGVDGSGAQTVLVIAGHGGKAALGVLLVKQGVGVSDGWVRRGLTKTERRKLLAEVAGEAGIAPSTIDHARIVAGHFLAANGASGTMPPFGLLDFAETVGFADLDPDPWPLERLIGRLCEAMDPARLSEAAVAKAMRGSAGWADAHPMVETWFEANLGKGLGSGRKWWDDRAVAALLAGRLQSRRRYWAEIAAWTALGLQHRSGGGDWEGFAILARELMGQRPLDEIGIMHLVAATSLEVAGMESLLGLVPAA
jgi:hypothetical protein